MKILVVDDVPANRQILRALLERAGHEALVAASAEEARREFGVGNPEVVLTDLHLENGEDGVALAKSLRRQSDGRSFRIALMTADMTVTGEPGGVFDAVLEKPVSLEALNRLLREAVQ